MRIGIIGMGEMGAAVGGRLRAASFDVFTDIANRSKATVDRVENYGISVVSHEALIEKSDLIMSIVPPGEASATAARVAEMLHTGTYQPGLIFWDCNAASPESKRKSSNLFADLKVTFVDGAIIGEPPTDSFNPQFYAASKDSAALDSLMTLASENALKIKILTGKDVGAASALKSAYSGITKGSIALLSAMVLSAEKDGAMEALLAELQMSRPAEYQKIRGLHRILAPRVYRFGPEMAGIAEFAKESGAEELYRGMARFYEQLADAQKNGDQSSNWNLLHGICTKAGNTDKDFRW